MKVFLCYKLSINFRKYQTSLRFDKVDTPHRSIIIENGNTNKQLLVRSRYSLYKKESDWIPKQKQRVTFFFELYPDVYQVYKLSEKLKWIYERADTKVYARTRLALWTEQLVRSELK